MAANRIRVAKDKADLVQALVASSNNKGPFQTYADVVAFAAALGKKRHKRIPLTTISTKEPAPISIEIFVSRGYDPLIKLIAIAQTQQTKILSVFDSTSEQQRLQIFEEYANGGLSILREELRGAVDYTDRILLILNAERFPQQSTNEEFDLSRFL